MHAKLIKSHADAKDALLWWCVNAASKFLVRLSILVLILSDASMLELDLMRQLGRHFWELLLLITYVMLYAPSSTLPPLALVSWKDLRGVACEMVGYQSHCFRNVRSMWLRARHSYPPVC